MKNAARPIMVAPTTEIIIISNVLLFLVSFGSSVGAIRLLVVVLLFGSKSLRVTVML